MTHPWRHALAAIFLSLVPLTGFSASISIIIDDVGHRPREGERAARLPGPVVCAVLPHGLHSTALAELAHGQGKEVILHQPMESTLHDKDPGPGKMLASMPDLEIAITLAYNLQSVPHVMGMNNHMGSALTTDGRAMAAVMEAMRGHQGLMFIDSVTSPRSVAARIARQFAIPTLERDIFLDNTASHDAIQHQFDQLVRIARRRGHAIGIGHPYPETMDVLEQRLSTLNKEGVTLVGLKQMLALTRAAQTNSKEEQPAWLPSSSRLPKVSKNSKPSPSPTY